jgi:hypothetical protein
MRYIKRYNLFESLTYNQIVENIKDILLPISDLGYDNIEVKLVKDYNYYIFVNIINYKDTPLSFVEIEDDILRLNDFVNNNGFEVNEIYYKKVQPDGRIFNKHVRDVAHSCRHFINSMKHEKPFYKEIKLAFLSIVLKEKK